MWREQDRGMFLPGLEAVTSVHTFPGMGLSWFLHWASGLVGVWGGGVWGSLDHAHLCHWLESEQCSE